jgi:RimJ/RimL family protein N-acetyltransferase
MRMLTDDMHIREATAADVALAFAWANDPETRQNSFSSDSIPFETHRKWFQSKLQDEACSFYVIEKHLTPIGVVRLDQGEETIVSITLAPEARGKGYGATALRLSLSEYWRNHDDPVFAYIKANNARSLRAFVRAGFHCLHTRSIHGVFCHVLQRSKR